MLSYALEKLFFKFSQSWFLFFVLSGIIYSLFGIFIGMLTEIPMLSIFIISLALIPALSKFISLTELLEGKVKQVSSKDENFSMFEINATPGKLSFKDTLKDYFNVVKAYAIFFLTIMLVFAVVGFLIENAAELFFSLTLTRADTGAANIDTTASFLQIFKNNLSVFAIAFIFSLILEFGATFIVVFNASIWGATLGSLFRQTITGTGNFTMVTFGFFLPHLFLESGAYFLAAIAGAILSKAIIKENVGSDKFNRVASQAMILIVAGAISLLAGAYIEATVISLTGY